jgi:hypothetical protein
LRRRADMKEISYEDDIRLELINEQIKSLHCDCTLRESCEVCRMASHFAAMRGEIIRKYVEWPDYGKAVKINPEERGPGVGQGGWEKACRYLLDDLKDRIYSAHSEAEAAIGSPREPFWKNEADNLRQTLDAAKMKLPPGIDIL